jgi:hypothetical protein
MPKGNGAGTIHKVPDMNDFIAYISGPDFAAWLGRVGVWLILATLVIALVALLLELRLPLRYYWGLPGHTVRSLLAGLHLAKPNPIWGRCYIQDSHKSLPLVACDLLNEQTHAVIKRTYSNHKGEYGFALQPGKYLLRAVKTRYRMPSILDPENVEVYEVDESFVALVTVVNKEVVPMVDLPLVPIKKMTELNGWERLTHYLRMFLFQLGNAFLILNVVLAIAGWAATSQPFYGLIIAVCLVLLFIKLYLLELIRVVGARSNA